MERNKTIDILKGIAIIFVVIGHSSVYGSGLFKFCYSFHMPLLIMISGYLIGYKRLDKHKCNDWISKRFNRLVRPHVIWSSFYFLLWKGYELSFYGYLNAVFINPILWFLINLFLYDYTIYMYVKLNKSRYACWIVLFLFCVFGCGFLLTKFEIFKNYALFFPFFLLGYLANDYFNKFKHIIKNRVTRLLIILLYPISLFIYTYGNLEVRNEAILLDQYLKFTNLKIIETAVWSNSHFIIPFLGICFFYTLVSISQLYLKNLQNLIIYIGKYSLQIYLLHYVFIYRVISNSNIINAILSSSLAIILSILVSKLINKNKVLNRIFF